MKPTFELADLLRSGLETYERRYAVSVTQRKAINAILNCRSATLGGHVDVCTACGLLAISYNSCRHRACPKCQWTAQVRWVRQRMDELINTQYFHLVFTIPHALNPLFLSNQTCLYNLLFRCAWETLDQLTRQSQWLGAQTGMLAVLHTWGQKLDFHPHLHCIVPGGGITPNGDWKAARKGFFIPVGVLSALFRGKCLAALKQLFRDGQLSFFGSAAPFENQDRFMALLAPLYRSNWVVYAKAPMSGPLQVLRYLGRYTHRIAISNRRILAIQDNKVRFAYKDRKDQDRDKTLTLDTSEFIRRFLLHVLPPGFHKIRYFGILAIRNRKAKLKALQLQLAPQESTPLNPTSGLCILEEQMPSKPVCTACGANAWKTWQVLPPKIFRSSMSYIPARPPPEQAHNNTIP